MRTRLAVVAVGIVADPVIPVFVGDVATVIDPAEVGTVKVTELVS